MNKLSLYTVLKVLFTAWFVLLTLRVRALVTETAFRKSEICWWNLIGVWREGVEGRTVHNQAVSYPEKLPVPSRRWKKLENNVFTLRLRQTFSTHTKPEKFKNATINSHFGFVFDETRSAKSRDYSDVIVFEKLRFQNVFCWHENAKPASSNSSGLKSVFEKFRFSDRLVWTRGLTGEIQLRLQISSV